MFRKSFLQQARLLFAAALLLAAAAPGSAAPGSVLPFGASTWRELGASQMRPLAVVFTTTDCTHCPRVIDGLADAIRKSRSRVRLVVVVMDGAGQEDALRRDRHYRKAGLLYAFAGDGMALRYSVNPQWRGLTPYVALVAPSGELRFHNGAPPADALMQFLRL